MPEAKPQYLQMTPSQKRQAVLDALHLHGGMVFGALKQYLGANQSLSSTINVMSQRGEIAKGERITGNQIKWLPVAEKTAEVRFGPEPSGARQPEKPTTEHGRIVRLLDKPNRSSGGQCANIEQRNWK